MLIPQRQSGGHNWPFILVIPAKERHPGVLESGAGIQEAA
jgi:hypothetical protein